MIHYDVPEPKLSSDFTIDDIHKIRYWNYECFKDATIEERMEYYEKQSNKVLELLGLTNIKRLSIDRK
jgi:hypothetical protein